MMTMTTTPTTATGLRIAASKPWGRRVSLGPPSKPVPAHVSAAFCPGAAEFHSAPRLTLYLRTPVPRSALGPPSFTRLPVSPCTCARQCRILPGGAEFHSAPRLNLYLRTSVPRSAWGRRVSLGSAPQSPFERVSASVHPSATRPGRTRTSQSPFERVSASVKREALGLAVIPGLNPLLNGSVLRSPHRRGPLRHLRVSIPF